MSIDDRLRTGLPAAVEDLRPDVDAELGSVLLRAGRRSRLRRAVYAGSVAAAAAVVAVALGLDGGDSRESVDPATPDGVQVLDSDRGSAAVPAPLQPGSYAIPFIGAADHAPWGRVEVPAGWGQDRLLLTTGTDLDPHLRRVELLAVDRVAPDPCEGNMVAVTGSVAAIVAALTEQRTVRAGSPRSVSIDGHSGQLVRFRVPALLDVENCWDGQSLRPFGLGGSWTAVFPGWTYRVWVLDVESGPLLVLAAHGPGTTPSELAELSAIVEGMTFTEPQ
jgi:hypothetical protein